MSDDETVELRIRARLLLADIEQARPEGAELQHPELTAEACGISFVTRDGRLGSAVATTSVLATLRWLLREEGQKPGRTDEHGRHIKKGDH